MKFKSVRISWNRVRLVDIFDAVTSILELGNVIILESNQTRNYSDFIYYTTFIVLVDKQTSDNFVPNTGSSCLSDPVSLLKPPRNI